MRDIETSIRNWLRVLQPGGFLYFVVPDFESYEKCHWPSRFNGDHKHSFSTTLTRKSINRPNHWHVDQDIIPLVQSLGAKIVEYRLENHNYDSTLPDTHDQTLLGNKQKEDVLCQICIIAQKAISTQTRKKPQHPTFIHSGNAGDIIYSLPFIKATGGGSLLLKTNVWAGYDESTTHPMGNVRLTESFANQLIPLIKTQPYIENVTVWKNEQFNFDLDKFRDAGQELRYMNLSKAYQHTFPGYRVNLNEPWLNCKSNMDYAGCIVINRTNRYHHQDISYEDYKIIADTQKRVIFLGLENEFTPMKAAIPQLEFVKTQNLLATAEIIKAATVFIGNQSLSFAIAEALKVPRILEVCLYTPNCSTHGENSIECYSNQEFKIWVHRAAQEMFRKYFI